MIITKIKKLKNNKYKIVFNEFEIITYDNVLIKHNLLYKKSINNAKYIEIVNDTRYYDIYNNVVKFILKKRRSELQIKKYLFKYDMSENDIDKIISKLKTIGLIDDVQYCKAFINDSVYLSKKGINKIKKQLVDQNISIEIIEKELKNIDKNLFLNKLEKIILKKINSNNKYSNKYLKQKILNEMINMGYEKNMILKILDNNLIDDSCALEKEFIKNYNKLSRKYSNNDLLNNIKKKLIYKGFEIEKINNLIEKSEIN